MEKVKCQQQRKVCNDGDSGGRPAEEALKSAEIQELSRRPREDSGDWQSLSIWNRSSVVAIGKGPLLCASALSTHLIMESGL